MPIALVPDPQRSAGQHRASDPSPRFGHGSYRLVALTLLVAALAVIAGASLVVRVRGQSGQLDEARTAATKTSPFVSGAELWLSTNLPHSARVIADPAVRTALIRSGFSPSAVTPPGQVVGCDAISFVVVTRALESAAITDETLAGCVRSALPVAIFGSGAAAVRIAETVPAGSHALASQRSRDSSDRTLAGAALAANPAVRAPTAIRTSLTAGQLDLRTATVLAVLAERTAVRITAVTGDPAEIAAGLPARTVDVVLTEAAALAPVLASLSEPFRPSAMVPTGRDSFRLTWPFTTAPIPQLN
ncbi:MAG: hypothetical protein ABI808_10490 [Pseudonocardiales bacterium]